MTLNFRSSPVGAELLDIKGLKIIREAMVRVARIL